MLFLIAFLLCLAKGLFEINPLDAAEISVIDKNIRDITIKDFQIGCCQIGYLDDEFKEYNPFDKKYKKIELEEWEIKYIQLTPDDRIRLIKRGDIAFACLPFNRSLSFIEKFFNHTNLDEESKKIISGMFKSTQNFELLFNKYNDIRLAQHAIPLLSNFITTICAPEKCDQNNIVQSELETFLSEFKNYCDDKYEEAYNTIEATPYIDVGLTVILIVFLYCTYKIKKMSSVKIFSEYKLILGAYGAFMWIEIPKLLKCLKLSQAHNQYTNAYLDIIDPEKNHYFQRKDASLNENLD